MTLDPKTEKIVRDHLAQKCPGLVCPACKGTSMNPGDLFLMGCYQGYSPFKDTTGKVMGAAANGLGMFIPLTCTACGASIFFPCSAFGIEPTHPHPHPAQP